MAKFIYKYESIKKVKKNLEKISQKELASIDLKIEKVKEVINDLENKRHQIKLNESDNRTIKISEVQSKIYYENYLNEMIDIQKKICDTYLEERKEKLEDLVTKSKEHKIFKTLEEKNHQNFTIEDNRLQQNQLDEISVQKFVRAKN